MPRFSTDAFLRAIRLQPRLTRQEELDLVQRLRDGDEDAASRLVSSYLRFVLFIARRYKSHGHPIADLVQEGTVGLMEAIKRFNPDRGVRLSTYSMWWIRASIQDYVLRSRSLVKIGTTAAQKSLFFNLRRHMAGQDDAAAPSEELASALARRFNTTVTEVLNFARRIARPDQSLEAPLTNGSDLRLIDQVADPAPSPEEALVAKTENKLWHEKLLEALTQLPPREMLIIQKRFLADRIPSRAKLAAEMGLSKERVRQLEIRALAKLESVLKPLRDHAEAATDATFNRPPTHHA
jgi:RNA polymerase sigma-32 factor